MFCKRCGREVADDAKFCPNCGAHVASDDNYQNQNNNSYNSYDNNYNNYNQGYNQNQGYTQNTDKPIKGGALGFVLSFFLGFIGLILAICLGDEACKKGALITFFVSLFLGIFIGIIASISGCMSILSNI